MEKLLNVTTNVAKKIRLDYQRLLLLLKGDKKYFEIVITH